MSAIDWLSDSIAQPRETIQLPEASVSPTALPQDVSVVSLGGPLPDAAGLFPPATAGLAVDIWHGSTSTDIARRLRAGNSDILPALQDLYYKILLAELDPPADSGPESALFLARLDSLLALGALEQTQALLSNVSSNNPEIFRRAFDTALLLHTEDQACATLRKTPELSPTFPARIFCLARGGDWDAAALTLETARALGFVDAAEDDLLARFLEPALSDEAGPVEIPARPSPLVFRMLEAIGEPIPSGGLPRAFAHSDLHTNSGWKTQLEAAERLVRTGALDPNFLLGLYTERKPAASGGIWDRVASVQTFEKALSAGDLGKITNSLPPAWQAMTRAELEVPFAQMFAPLLTQVDLSGESARIAFEMGLLSSEYREYADAGSLDERYAILSGIAAGKVEDLQSKDATTKAVLDGFRSFGIPVRLQTLTTEGRMGEAILRAIELFDNGSKGNLDELTDALVFFRSIGLEETARRASLQVLLLDRRG